MKLGVSVRTVSAWETGREPRPSNRRALADLFGGNPAEYIRDFTPADPALIEQARIALAEARFVRPQAVGEGPYFEYVNDGVLAALEHYIADPDHPDETELVWLEETLTKTGRYRVQAHGKDAYENLRARILSLVDHILGQD